MKLNKGISILIIMAIVLSIIFPYSVYSEENKTNESNDEILKEETPVNEENIEQEEKEPEDINSQPIKPNVLYTTHVQYIGWQKYVKNGEMAGTTGKALRLEGIKIKLDDYSLGNIEYRTHIQNIGWESSFKKNDEISGTSGKALRLEAIQIKLTNDLANYYDIYYRVHAENFGWLGWAKNGESSGTAGYSYRLEGIEIKLVDKNSSFPDYGKRKAYEKKEVLYSTHVQYVGWQKYAFNGQTSGTSGKGLRLEAIKIKLENQDYPGSIEYKTQIEGIGWENSYKRDNQLSGTSGRGLRLEAIRIRLTGEMSEQYDVYYRVHSENIGWLGWAKNDEISGTIGFGYRLEAIQIRLVKKGESAPGNTNNPNYLRKIQYKSYQGSWEGYVYDGAQSGKISKTLESIAMNLTNAEYPGNINYSTYIYGSGWQNYVSNGKASNSNNKKIEAIKINITGEISNYYDIYYSVYVPGLGWTGWAKNDSPCGNIGNDKYLQGYKVKLVKKGTTSGATNITYIEAPMSIKYTSYIKGGTWQNYVSDGAISGTTGQSKSIQGVKIKVNKKIPPGSVSYSTHVSNVGWQSYASDDTQSGRLGKVEAIKIKLNGELSNKYDIYYRVHVQNVGWMGWTSNNLPAGTTAGALGIEAIQIKIIEKGQPAPENDTETTTVSPYLEAHWETDSEGHRYFYDVFGNIVKGGAYSMGSEIYYFGPSGIFLGTKNLQILDISAHNGVIDWQSVASSGVYGVILRVAASAMYRDSRLKENVAGCKKYGIPYGIYIYSYAENYSEGVAYANFTKSLINEFGMNPTLGIFLDLESNNITQFMGPTEYTAVINGFYSVIPNAEVYTYTNYANTSLNTTDIRNKITWIADYRGYCGYTGSYRMWQYTSTAGNAGVNGNVDKSILYSFR